MAKNAQTDIKRFLIVDDNEESQVIVRALLSQLQIQSITMESSGEAALEQVETKRIEFLIVNWDLGGKMSAGTFLQRIKSRNAFRHLPFTIYSESFDEDDLALLKDYGIENIFSAPIDRDEALQVLERSIKKENEMDQSTRRLRQAAGYLSGNDTEEAMNMVKEAMHNEDTKSLAHSLKGEIHVARDELPDAETDLNKSLELDSQNSNAMQTMAKVYSRTDRHDEAIQMLSQMVQLSPKNLSNMISLGGAYVDADEHDKARAELEKVTKVDPDNPDVKDQLGKMAFKEKNFDLAQEILANSLNKDELGRTFNNVGIGQVAKGDFDDGIKSYDVAMKILGDNKYSHLLIYNKGLAYKKKGDLAEAFEMFYQSYKRMPAYDKAYSSLVRLVNAMKKENIPVDGKKVEEVKALRKSEVDKLKAS